jgi:serine/threonine-protein kinase
MEELAMGKCPTADELFAFAVGRLAAEAREATATHIEECAACLAALHGLTDQDDPLLCELRKPVPAELFAPRPACARGADLSSAERACRKDGLPAIPGYDVIEDLELQFEIDQALQSQTQIQDTSRGNQKVSTQSNQFAQDDAAPKEMGDFEILEMLGQGGMGVVYKARQRGLNRLVALKMIRAGPEACEEELARFRIEAEAVARLQHPNIVQIFEVGKCQDRNYLVLEYVAGGSLAEKMGAPCPPHQAAQLMETLARAIHHAHQQGIVHRDLKPANILLQSADCNLQIEKAGPAKDPESAICNLQSAIPKITDFGLAKMLASAGPGLTHTGDFMGTPKYAAPEQASGILRDIGPHSDIFALGAIFYELLTGLPPFRGTTVLETLDQVRMQEPLAPTRLQKNLPRDLETICLKCLQKHPGRRYTSGLFLAEDLHRYLTGQPIMARPTGRVERLLKWARRKPAVAALITVITLATVSLLVGGWWSAVSLRAAAKREAQQRQKAEARFAQAVDAVEQMLAEVGAVDLADVPLLEPIRKKLLLKARVFFEDFLQEGNQDSALHHLAGRAYRRLGDIQSMMDEHAAAEQSYSRARALFLEMEPLTVEDRRELGQICNNLGVLLKRLGRYPEAEKFIREALARRKELGDDFQKRPEFQQDLAGSYYELGTVLARMPGQRAQAEKTYQKALDIQEKLSKSDSENVEFIRARARTLNNLGILLKFSRPTEARKAFEDAVALYEDVAGKDPRFPLYQRELARSINNLADFFGKSGQDPKAEKNYARALEILKQLSLHFPTVPVYRHELAAIYHNLAVFLDDRKRLDESSRAYHEALKLREKLAGDSPLVLDYQQGLARVHVNLGHLLEMKQWTLQAEKHYRRAISLLEKIRGKPAYDSDLGWALHHRAWIFVRRAQGKELVQGLDLIMQGTVPLGGVGLLAQTRPALMEAHSCLLRAVSRQRAARAADRRNAFYIRLLYEHTYDLAGIELRLGNHAAAAQRAQELPRLYPDRPNEYVVAAETLAQAIPLAVGDLRLTPKERQEIEEQYARAAIHMLQQAVQRGFGGARELKTLPAYKPLHIRQDFKKLVEEIEKRKTTRDDRNGQVEIG